MAELLSKLRLFLPKNKITLDKEIWAVLYIYLFFRMLKENAAREEKYQAMIDHLSSDIAEGIENIRECLDALASSSNPNSL